MSRKLKILLPLLVVAAAVVVAFVLVKSFAEGFRRGETLVRIDERDYRLAVSQAEQQVAQARVRLAREEAEAEIAREEYRDLAADGAVGDVSPLTLHEPQLAEARAAVEAPQPSDPSSP